MEEKPNGTETSFAGIFLLIPLLLKCNWFGKAVEILSFNRKTRVSVSNFILTLVAGFAGGIKRIWHLDSLDDPGLGIFTGMFRTLKSARKGFMQNKAVL